MSDLPSAYTIRQVRCEMLSALRLLYPAPLQAEQLHRSLLIVFPDLSWSALRRDFAYLCEKGYLQRVVGQFEKDPSTTTWRRRWFRLTSAGLEVADHLVKDPALDPDA